MSDEPKFDLIHLVIRTDEKYEEIRAESHDIRLAMKDVVNRLDGLDRRINLGLSVTGQENEKRIAEQAVTVGKLQTVVDLLNQAINNPETGVFKQTKDIKEAVGLIYKGIAGIFFTILCGGVVLYALRIMKLS